MYKRQAQQRWFRQFFALHRSASIITVGIETNWVILDDFVSPALWAMLNQAEALGIALVSSGTHAPVVLYSEGELSLDAAMVPGGDICLRPMLRLGGEEMLLRESGAIGDHGVYVVAQDQSRTVHLAPVVKGLSAAEVALLSAEAAAMEVRVPASERESFLTDGITELRGSFRIESADGSVELLAPRTKVAVLMAAWKRGHRLLSLIHI